MSSTDAYEYALPDKLIARTPAERRDGSRLLVLGTDGTISDEQFSAFPMQLRAGDVLVLNETQVFSARLRFRRPSGGGGEVLLLRPAGDAAFSFAARDWLALVRPARRYGAGARIDFGPTTALVTQASADGLRHLRFPDDLDLAAFLAQAGEVPLPPYVGPGDAARNARYQTVFARVPGSVAAPTASLHFTPEVLDRIRTRGIETVSLTLDVGIGTFRPMRDGALGDHRMHAEAYAIPPATAEAIARAATEGRRVVAAGTTVLRALEGAAQRDGIVRAGAGQTELFVTPGFRFRVVDALLTNFHLPKSTLLVLVSAFAGYEPIRKAYAHAILQEYRFFSFGDAMFTERER